MTNAPHFRFTVSDRSYQAFVKREVHYLAKEAGFSARRLSELDIIVLEMTSNLLKHAKTGEVLVRLFQENNTRGIELISIDNGPGIADPENMQKDGVSTTKTLGHGLGAIQRLADFFQLYSLLDWGTILLARLYDNPVTHSRSDNPAFPLTVRSVLVAKPGETVCGDGCRVSITPDYGTLFLGDGLGHGPAAHEAVTQAIGTLPNTRLRSPARLIELIHEGVRKTRGLVGSVVVYDHRQQQWLWCGVGNIMTRLLQATVVQKSHLPYSGIIGTVMPTLHDETIPAEWGQTIVMCSDGIQSRWDATKYPYIFKYDLTILAAAIYKDNARQTDDVSIVVGRLTP
ncbi:serine/threonine protein kinase [Fibrisoma montanum]|uniref:Serine/threonine protein kinase n=1 Tax=Fibrisoma montanum TaxID=2305895 RepID=A0A418MFC9_9BACT|nr:ATP-binding SpoIIE family protein phosphatase [Fibrisoma montanum]RIV25510.1 serine/threonine protein kinase [Fibrisoma montanum]